MIILDRYKPGLWENWFGVDNGGDTIALIPDLFADDKDPRLGPVQEQRSVRMAAQAEFGCE